MEEAMANKGPMVPCAEPEPHGVGGLIVEVGYLYDC